MKKAKDPLEDDDLQPLERALQGAYGAQEAAGGRAELRHPERGLDDVLWNAVVAGHPNRFDSMQAVFAFAGQLASKLEAVGALPAAAAPHAAVVLAGLLNFLWRSQNPAYLDPEFAEAQAGTLKVVVAELARDWAPPTRQPWFKKLAAFAAAVDAALARVQRLRYDDVYKHLDPEMAGLQALAEETLADVQAHHGPALPAATAWVMGTVIRKNTFSPLDGSVPEDIDERLTGIYDRLEGAAEERFFPWLAEGFRAVRERPLGELQRWKMGIEPKPGRAKKAPGKRRPRPGG